MHFINLNFCGFGAEMIYQTIGLKKRMHNKLGLNNLLGKKECAVQPGIERQQNITEEVSNQFCHLQDEVSVKKKEKKKVQIQVV